VAVAVAAKSGLPLFQSELADSLGVEGATVIAMIGRFEAGMVARKVTVAAELRKALLSPLDPQKVALPTDLLEAP
jgi:hypothetical protein